jgi:hypothetical protein
LNNSIIFDSQQIQFNLILKEITPYRFISFTTFFMNKFDLLHGFADSTAAPVKRCNAHVASQCLPLAV